MIIKIMSQYNALRYSSETNKKILMISIVGGKDSSLVFKGDGIVDVFRMFFEDIERPIGKYKVPSREDFNGLKEFLDKNISSVDEIVVHCHAGVSRSAACASAIARYVGIDDSFIWSSNDYMPNRLVFKYAIDELDLNLEENEIRTLYKANEDAYALNCEFILKEDLF